MVAFPFKLFVTLCYIPYVLCQYTTIWLDHMEESINWNYTGTISWATSSSNGQCAINPCHRTREESWIRRETDVSSYSSLRVNYTVGSQQLGDEGQCRLYSSYTNDSLQTRKLMHFDQGVGEVWYLFPENAIILPDASQASTVWLWFETHFGGYDYCYWDEVSLEGIIMTSVSAFPSIDTLAPTNYPTEVPSQNPTNQPTLSPTAFPSADPTLAPSDHPTAVPSRNPSLIPRNPPTAATSFPTELTQAPTDLTRYPSRDPTSAPSDTMAEGAIKIDTTELKALDINIVNEKNNETNTVVIYNIVIVFLSGMAFMVIIGCFIYAIKIFQKKSTLANEHSANIGKEIEDKIEPETKFVTKTKEKIEPGMKAEEQSDPQQKETVETPQVELSNINNNNMVNAATLNDKNQYYINNNNCGEDSKSDVNAEELYDNYDEGDNNATTTDNGLTTEGPQQCYPTRDGATNTTQS